MYSTLTLKYLSPVSRLIILWAVYGVWSRIFSSRNSKLKCFLTAWNLKNNKIKIIFYLYKSENILSTLFLVFISNK
jgi:hypothetical protein